MATTSQILANQKNAQSSTGPRTAEGKAASSQNSTQHGLAGSFRVLGHENQQEFDDLLASYCGAFPASNVDEQFMIEEMAQARWRLARIRRIEGEVVRAIARNPNGNPDRALAQALLDNNADAFKTLHRYAVAAERSYYRAHNHLLRSRERQADGVSHQLATEPAGLAEPREEAQNAPVRNEPNISLRMVSKTDEPHPGVAFPAAGPIARAARTKPAGG